MSKKIYSHHADTWIVPASSKLKKKLARLSASLPYKKVAFNLEFSIQLFQAMERRRVTIRKLAHKSNVSMGFCESVLNGGTCTTDDMVALAFALKYNVQITLQPVEESLEK